MKQLFSIKSILSTMMLIGVLNSISCEQERFDYNTLGTYYDGIQNLDEEGIDCGGNSGTPCGAAATCTDGIKNGDETGIDCGGSECDACPEGTPRADALTGSGLPYYFTFEADNAGLVLEPFTVNTDGSAYGQGVDITYGVANPDGTANDLVAQIIRPDDNRFGGFEDYKFQTLDTPIDFSVYHKWTMDVFIPTGQNFSGSLAPEVVLILMDYDANFFERWTEIPVTIDEADFGTWVTLEFDGTNAAAAGSGVLLPAQTTYTNVSLRLGGGGHAESGTFYVKDLVPTTESFGSSSTPRADALANSGLPYYFSFEADDAGLVLAPFTVNADGSDYGQGVDITYGVANPDGTANDLVAQVIRPDDQRFGGFEDFKFQTLDTPIDFSVYHKWTMDVFIPTGQDFSGSLAPQVDLVLMDYDANFWERWTVISLTIDEADFGSWVTLEFDGTDVVGANGETMQNQTTYTNVTVAFGGGGHAESGIFYVKDLVPTIETFSTSTTPRADALANSGVPYYFSFEADDAGLVLNPFTVNADGSDYVQGVDITYGVDNPDGTANDLVAQVIRPDDNRFGGFEDFKFQTLDTPIDFSVYHKWTMDVFIPTGQDFSGSLAPQVDLVLMDYEANFWERWTVISLTIDEADFGSWVTLTFDGTNAAAGSGVLLPAQGAYTNVTLVFGGGGHAESGTFYVKDLVPFQ